MLCACGQWTTGLQRLAATTAEALSPDIHHHHTVTCGRCGSAWFDDAVRGPLGQPVPARRDSIVCACPERGGTFTPAVVLVPVAESACHCGADVLAKARAA